MPTPPPMTPLLHRSLGMGLTMLVGAFLVLRYLGIAPLAPSDDMTPVIEYALSGLPLALLAVALLLLKPRVPGRRPSQSIGEYWSTPDITAKVFLVWFLMEGAGMLGAVGYFLTGAAAPAAAMLLAIVVFWLNGPDTFGK